jgi:hypothetical protein
LPLFCSDISDSSNFRFAVKYKRYGIGISVSFYATQ